METRTLGRTGRKVTVVGLGAWQIGGSWGTVPPQDARAVVRSALDAGVTLIDTADVYGDGRSERLIVQVLTEDGREEVFEVGVAAARELAGLLPAGMSLAQFALRWIIDQPGVTTVIPGARAAAQAQANAAAADHPPLRPDQLAGVRDVYDRLIRRHVHDRW